MLRICLLVILPILGLNPVLGNDLVLVPDSAKIDLSKEEAFVQSVDEIPANLDDVFEPTSEWKEIKPGQVVPAGLHVRINMSTGKKEAKLMEEKEGDQTKIENNNNNNNIVNSNKSKESIGKIDDFKNDLKDPHLRSFRDLHDQKIQNNIKTNTEFEQIDFLMQNFDNSSYEGQLVILEDLEYFLHQYDNARDFANVGGLQKIIARALGSEKEEMQAMALMVFSSCAQSHNEVKEKVLATNLLTDFVGKLATPGTSDLVTKRLVHALSCQIRNHRESLNQFRKLEGPKIAVKKLYETSDSKLQRNILTFLVDIFGEEKLPEEFVETIFGENDSVQKEKLKICDFVGNLMRKNLNLENLGIFEQVFTIFIRFQTVCDWDSRKEDILEPLSNIYRDLKVRNEQEELEMEPFLNSFKHFISKHSSFRDEL